MAYPYYAPGTVVTGAPVMMGAPVIQAPMMAGGYPPFIANGNHITIFCIATGRHLRIEPNGMVDGNGGLGQWATFVCHVDPQGVRFQNYGNRNHWLRIHDNGVCDGTGSGGNLTYFRIVTWPDGTFSLQSVHAPMFYVGVDNFGNPVNGAAAIAGVFGRFRLDAARM